MFEFHISKMARDFYELREPLFSMSGNVILANFQAARNLAHAMNDKLDLQRHPELAINAGQINAMGLIDEILHYVTELYRAQVNPRIFGSALEFLYDVLGKKKVAHSLKTFAEFFPPRQLYTGEVDVDSYFSGLTEGIPNAEILLEELLHLWLANVNPAFSPYLSLFNDTPLKNDTEYLEIIHRLEAFFREQPGFGPEDLPLVALLRSPAIAVPHSLPGQLEYIRKYWGLFLKNILDRLLSSLE